MLALVNAAHCAGMCGVFAIRAAAGMRTSAAFWNLCIYTFGKAATYIFLGTLAGALGSQVAARVSGVELALGIIVALFLMRGAWRLWRGGAAAAGSSVNWTKLIPFRLPAADSSQGRFFLGLATGYLPCGVTALAVLESAAAASPLNGAVLMSGFGLGTIPALVAVGLASRPLRANLSGNRVRILAAGMLFAAGRAHSDSGHVALARYKRSSLPVLSLNESDRVRVLTAVAKKGGSYGFLRVLAITFSLAILAAVPLSGLVRIDVWRGQHLLLREPVGLFDALKGFAVAMAGLYGFTFLSNMIVGRFFCGWGCPVGYVSRLGEAVTSSGKKRGRRLLNHLLGAGFVATFVGSVMLWWVDWRVMIDGSLMAKGITLGVFLLAVPRRVRARIRLAIPLLRERLPDRLLLPLHHLRRPGQHPVRPAADRVHRMRRLREDLPGCHRPQEPGGLHPRRGRDGRTVRRRGVHPLRGLRRGLPPHLREEERGGAPAAVRPDQEEGKGRHLRPNASGVLSRHTELRRNTQWIVRYAGQTAGQFAFETPRSNFSMR